MSIDLLVRKNILALSPYSSARDEFEGFAEVYLDANESPYPEKQNLNRYPDPYQKELKKLIAGFKNVSAENIFLGNGSDEAIDLLIRIFCEPKTDSIITCPPTYGMYKVSADINDISIIEVPLLEESFELNVSEILKHNTSKTKLLFLCSPNNPSGNQFKREDVIHLIENFDGIVVVDEAYIDFADYTLAKELNNYDNLVIIQTFSKAHGLASIRLGMAFTSERIIHFFNKVKPPYNVNKLTQNRAIVQLTDNLEEWKKQVSEVLEERKKLKKELQKISIVEKTYPSDANFILAKIKNADEVYKKLISKGVLVRNRSKLKGCESCLRITVGKPEENIRLLNELKGI